VKKLIADNELETLYKSFYARVQEKASDVTEKQQQIAALILLADCIASDCIFKDELMPLTVEDLQPYLLTEKEVNKALRLKEYIVSVIAENSNKFLPNKVMPDDYQAPNYFSDVWGKFGYMGKTVMFSKHKLEEFLKAREASFKTVKEEWFNIGFIEKYKSRYDSNESVNGSKMMCVTFNL
jgi:hypothetical protein